MQLNHYLKPGMIRQLQELCEAHAVSGYEDSLAQMVIKNVEPFADEITLDPLGNVIAQIKGNGKSRGMITAHLDEIGLMVRHIDERGFLFVSPIGGNRPQNLFARACTLRTDDHRLIPGIVNHLAPGRPKGIDKLPEIEDFFIDVGVNSREEAGDWGIEIGNTVSLQYEFQQLGHKLAGKALDDRALVLIQMETMRILKEGNMETPDLYFVFTVQEEVGCRGAKTTAYAIDPDWALALDITVANDLPATLSQERITEIDHGPAIKVMDKLSNSHTGLISSPKMVRQLKQVAKKENIPYQLEVFTAGSTDAATIHLERKGIPSGAILLPTRYVHAYEMASAKDMAYMTDLLLHYLRHSAK